MINDFSENEIDYLIERIEWFNIQNKIKGDNSDIYFDRKYNELYVTIKAVNGTTIEINFNKNDIDEMLNSDFLKIIEKRYKQAITKFNIYEHFKKLYCEDFVKNNNFTPHKFLNMIEDDYKQLLNIDYSKEDFL